MQRVRAPQQPYGVPSNEIPSSGVHIPRANMPHPTYPLQQNPPGLQRQPSFYGNRQHPPSIYDPENNAIFISCRLGAVSINDVSKVLIAEFLATFLLLFFGCSGGILTPLTFGIAVIASTQAFGEISGAHMNPAVTIAAAIMGKIKSCFLIPVYLIAQFLGAILGFGLYFVILGTTIDRNPGMCMVNGGDFLQASEGPGKVFAIEFILSIFYIMTMCAMWDRKSVDNGEMIPLKRGLIYTGMLVSNLGIMGWAVSLNSFRAFIPALFFNDDYHLPYRTFRSYWDNQWVYWVGPNLGAVIGACLYLILRWLHRKSLK